MKNRILRSALSVALCAAMLLSQGLTAFADGEIDLAAAKSSPVQESSEESEAKTPAETLTPETKKELPASTEDETKTETTTGQPTAEDDTAKETTAKTPAVVSEDVIAALPYFSFNCENSNCNASESIERNDLVFTIGKVNSEAGTVDITFDSAAFSTSLAKFNKEHGKHNLAKEQPIVVTLTWNAEKDSWCYAGEGRDIIVPVECDKSCHPDPIPEPSEEGIAAQLEYKLTCTNEDFSDEHSMPESNLLAQYISNIDWNRNETNATATIDVDQILDTYKFNDTHKLVFLNPMKVSLEYENNQWGLAASQDNVLDIKVICTKVPATPIEPGEINEEVLKAIIDVKMKCTNQYHEDSNFDVPDENLKFEVGEITGEKGTYSFNVTLDPNDYLALYNGEHEEHSLVDKDKKEIVINFTLADGKVTPSQKQVIIEVTCNATKPIPLPSESNVIAALPGFSFDCENSNCNASESIDLKDLAFTIGEVNSPEGTVDITFDNAAFSTSLAKFNEKYGKHNLAKEEPIVVTLTWNAEKCSWYYAGNEQDIIVPVECSFPFPLPSESDVIAALPDFSFDCENSNCNASESIELNDLVFTIGEVNSTAGTVDITFDNAAFSTSLAKFNEKYGKHNLAKEEPIVVTLTWNAEKCSWYYAGNEQDIIVPVECSFPSKDNFISFIEQSVKVQIECVNENRLHNSETITWPLEEGSYSRGYWKIDDVVVNEQGGYTATITVDPSYCLDAYNKDNGEHYLVLHNSILSLAFNFNAASETWEPVEQHDFYLPVTCNVPAVPTYKDLEELLGNMTVYCVNENHLVSKAYPITWNTIGGLNQKPVQNDDGTFSMEITVSYDPFKDLFDDEFGPHDYVENIELARSVVSLKWSEIEGVGAWRVDGSFINSFNVICDTTSGGGEDPGTNPGGGDNGNNGGNNNGGSTGGGSSVSRRDDDDDWEPLPNNNYRVTKKNDKPSQNTQIVVRDPADNSDNTSSNTGSDSGKHNPETGDTTTAFAAMALAAVSLGGVVLLGRKKK